MTGETLQLEYAIPTPDPDLAALSEIRARTAREVFEAHGLPMDIAVARGPWAGGVGADAAHFITAHLNLLVNVAEATGAWVALRIGGRLFDNATPKFWDSVTRAFRDLARRHEPIPPDPQLGEVVSLQNIRLDVGQGRIWIGWREEDAAVALDGLSTVVLPALPEGRFVWHVMWLETGWPGLSRMRWCLLLPEAKR